MKVATLAGALAVAVIAAAAPRAAPETIPASELRRLPPIVFLWGDEGRVRQTATADVYVAQPGETRARRLRAWPAGLRDKKVYGAAQVAWSPDGRQIGLLLGWWCGDPCFDVARMSAVGRRLTRLPRPADFIRAAWSSDWRAAVTTFSGSELWTVPMRGGKPTRIWRSPGANARENVEWSPRGRQLVVPTQRGLLRMTRAGQNVVRLTRKRNDVAPVWSPNGREIAFVREPVCPVELDECLGPARLYVIGADGRRLRLVYSGPSVGSLVWTRNSRSIVFASSSDPDLVQTSISVVSIQDRRRQEIVAGRHATPIEFSRDGRKLLFSLEGADRGDELWVMDVDGSRQTRLPFYRARWTMFSVDWR